MPVQERLGHSCGLGHVYLHETTEMYLKTLRHIQFKTCRVDATVSARMKASQLLVTRLLTLRPAKLQTPGIKAYCFNLPVLGKIKSNKYLWHTVPI